MFQVPLGGSRSGSPFLLFACGFLLFATSLFPLSSPAARSAWLLGRKGVLFEHAVENATEGGPPFLACVYVCS